MVHTPTPEPVPPAQGPSPTPSTTRQREHAPAPTLSPGPARKAGALVWLLVPPLLFSALVHTTDPDVGGIQGLSRPGVVASVVVWAAPMAVLALLTLWTRVRVGPVASITTALVLAAVPGWLLFALGSTPATPLARLGSFLGITALCLATLTLAVLPASALGWPGRPAAGDS